MPKQEKTPQWFAGLHCNLTHDKTYFEVFAFALACLCLCLGFVIAVFWVDVVVVPGLVTFAADDELLVLVTTLDFAGGCELLVFWVVWAEAPTANAPINKKLNTNFFMTVDFWYHKVKLYLEAFFTVNSGLTGVELFLAPDVLETLATVN